MSESGPNPALHPVSSSAAPRDPVANLTAAAGQLDLVEDAPAASAAPPAAKEGQAPKPKGEKKEKKPKAPAAGGTGHPLECNPEFLAVRMDRYTQLKAKQDAELAAKPRAKITITLPDGATKEGTAWETSPLDIAKEISKSLSERIVISKVNGELWDLPRPFEGDASVAFFDFDTPEGQRVFWHSAAHVLGQAAERHYGCLLCIGPPIDSGFFYEMGMTGERVIKPEDFPALETIVKSAIKDKQLFERLVVTKEELLQLFEYNTYKQQIIKSKIADGTSTTVYRNGPMVDLCVGPHIPHTGRIKAMAILKNSSSYFLGDQNNDSLQRLYGIAFPDAKQMTEHKKFLEEAAARDHRKIGKDQDLFFFHEMSPGACFWLPHGTRIYNTLADTMKTEYRLRGFDEVSSPNMFNAKLWQASGHWANYKDDMFILDVDKEQFGLKPMNCPGHCLMFASRDRSYRELPIRYAEFGVIHRNEASGALSGLTRVRRFIQDDAHIFCKPDQIEEEMTGCFDFLQNIYGKFGFKFKLELSTRPEKFLGEIATWDAAEKRLSSALDKFVPGQWDISPGDGAFYGPKIDVTIQDAMKRWHQCATIQLDFQLPERFKLEYRHGRPGAENELERPVVIHRAVLGSLERFIAILTEHFAGKWPFWISPRQVLVVPVTATVYDYARSVSSQLWDAGFFADVDTSDNTLPKKIRNGQLAQYNFVFVVGHTEMEARSVNIRNRDDAKGREEETVPLDHAIELLGRLKASKGLENKLA